MTRTLLGITYTDDGGKFQHRGPGPKRELCIMACVFCKDAVFRAWLTELDQIIHPGDVAISEAGAKGFILGLCQVTSRNDLDTNAAAAERFHQLVRLPFLAWKEAQHAG